LSEKLLDSHENTELIVIENTLQQAINDCIAELEQAEERQALLLYYFSGKVYREIAYVIGKSLSTAKNRVNQAQKKIKRCLSEMGFESW
jgi:RNA polymerase sigma factor (sigma-70 family)